MFLVVQSLDKKLKKILPTSKTEEGDLFRRILMVMVRLTTTPKMARVTREGRKMWQAMSAIEESYFGLLKQSQRLTEPFFQVFFLN